MLAKLLVLQLINSCCFITELTTNIRKCIYLARMDHNVRQITNYARSSIFFVFNFISQRRKDTNSFLSTSNHVFALVLTFITQVKKSVYQNVSFQKKIIAWILFERVLVVSGTYVRERKAKSHHTTNKSCWRYKSDFSLVCAFLSLSPVSSQTSKSPISPYQQHIGSWQTDLRVWSAAPLFCVNELHYQSPMPPLSQLAGVLVSFSLLPTA